MRKSRQKTGLTGRVGRLKSASLPSSSFAAAQERPPPALPADWQEFLSLLIEHRVRFIVVGAHALAALGRPRNTLDLDLFVEPSPGNASRLGKAIRAFGFPGLADVAGKFSSGQRMARLGVPPLSIDIMNHIDGVSFSAAWKGRIRSVLGGLPVAFLGKAEFRRNKRASGRAKDLLDLALLDE